MSGSVSRGKPRRLGRKSLPIGRFTSERFGDWLPFKMADVHSFNQNFLHFRPNSEYLQSLACKENLYILSQYHIQYECR